MTNDFDSEEICLKFGQRIKALRGRDMTQTQLGEAINLSRHQVSRIEKGTSSIRFEDLFRLARLFNVSAESLVADIDTKQDSDQLKTLIRMLTAGLGAAEKRRLDRLLSVIQDLEILRNQ